MGKKTLSQAKLDIDSCLKETVDPELAPTEKKTIWDFFDNECAFCPQKLDSTKEEGDMDHLVSKKLDGLNHISNRVLSCKKCNREKLDKPWRQFMNTTKSSDNIKMEKVIKIENWIKKNFLDDSELSALQKNRELAKNYATQICSDLDKRVKELRQVRNN